MQDTEIATLIRQFIRREIAPDCGDADIGDDASLLNSGILDSFGIMTLLSFIEDSFDVKIPVDQIEPANFETVASISSLVAPRCRMRSRAWG